MTDNVKEIATEFAKSVEQVKGLGEELKGRMGKGEQGLSDLKSQVDEALTNMNGFKTSLTDIEQKLARRGSDEQVQQKSLTQQLMDSDSYKDFVSNPSAGKSAKMHTKATITSATTDAAGSAGSLILPQNINGIVATPDRKLTIRDLLGSGNTSSNAITYIRETGFTNAAASQANEGDLKAQSDIQFDEATVNVKTIAHWMKASRQVLDDAPQLESYIRGRLIYGLKLVEEQQLLNGDNTGGNLHGIIPQASAFADPASMASYTIIDQLRLAQLQAVLAEYPATGHVLNPIDWARIELTKDNEGRYIIGQPQSTANPTMWGLPVVETQAIQAGNFLTGAFNMGATLYDRQQAAVAIATENQDDFVKNLITMLAEERLALAVFRPEAFVYGALAAKTAV
ncbi:phage major capsid protein [Psychrobacter namhaensis]|uniref:phage major capsid protein n=1 Tax=Psychrobacter namhaensis TaxID=292734 RepID=UPI0018E0559D|nr:phage major capsid protein [Psychrobacter namhaensis]